MHQQFVECKDKTGTVIMFNRGKGFGLIEADDGTEVFFHFSEFIKSGYPKRSIRLNMRLSFQAIPDKKNRRPFAVKIMSTDTPAPKKKRISGIVKSWNPRKNYGFISCGAVKKDVFFTRSDVDGGVCHKELDESLWVTFVLVRSGNNPKARSVRI